MLCGNVFADYEKVTSTAEITDGEYLIVWEGTQPVAFDGALETLDAVSNTIDVSIVEGVIASTETIDKSVFTIDVTNGTLKSASGKYIGVSSNSNGLKQTENADTYKHTFAIDENENAVIASVFDGSTMTLRFNSSSNQNRFRYYKSGQQAIQLYKKVAGGQTDTRTATTLTLTFVENVHKTSGTVGEELELPATTITAGETVINAVPTWSSSDETVAIYYEGKVKLLKAGTTTMKATYEGDANTKPSSASYTLTVTAAPYTSIAAMLQDVTSTKTTVTYQFQELLVTFVQGSNTYVSDGRNGFLFYGSDLGLNAGDKITGSVVGQLYTFNGLPELALEDEDIHVEVASSNNEIAYTKIAPAALESNINKAVIIENAVFVGAGSGKNLTFKVGDNEFTVYNNWSIAVDGLEADKSYTLTGFGSVYAKGETTTYQLYLASFEETQAAVWTWADIKADFTNGSFFTAEETTVITAGLKMNADGTFTRVTADDATANAVITGKYHSNEHGLGNFSATVKVEGPVKVSMGTCAWGGDVTVKDASGATVATFNTNTGACYHNDKASNIVSAFYKGEATTLTISGGSYTPYFAVEAVNPANIPSDCKITFDLTNSDAQGVAPAEATVEMGSKYTIPRNFTLYKEGYTLTGWSDGKTVYAVGQEMTAPAEEALTLTPVFTANEVSLADRTGAVTVKFDFQRQNGAPTVAYQNTTGIWVAQATVNGKVIDVKADFDTNNGGKFANGNWSDWAQLNAGTKFTVPSCKGATVSMEAYGDITTTTIDGQSDYTQGKTISYTIGGAAETVDVVIGDGSYYRYIQVVLPVVQQQGGGESFENVAGTVDWPLGNEANGTLSDSFAGAISSTSVSIGEGLTVETAKYFDTEMVKYTPQTSNAGNVEGVMIEYRVKAASGVKFKPTKIEYAAVKVGTDNATYSWSYTVDGQESTITEIEPKANLLRNNGSNSSTAQLMHTESFSTDECEEFTFRFYISKTANNKNICIGKVTISGTVNGESVAVDMYDVTATASPEEGGSVNIYPAGGTYEAGTELTLTATDNFGYDFVNWTNAAGEELSTDPKFKYTVNSNAVITANFQQVNTYELALSIDGTNNYMVTVNPAPTVVDGKNMYEAGTAVQLTANQYEGLVTFTNWSDGETGSTKLIAMNEDIQLTAFYAEADIIAGWDFYEAGNSGRTADFAAQDNDGDALNLVNTETGETSAWLDKSTLGGGGYESFKGAAVNWRTGSGNGDVGNWHWQTKINAEAFTDINVQFQMLYNYNAYQKYNVEYSLDGEQWTNAGSISMTGAKAVASYNDKLPAAANNQKDLYIRMVADKSSNVDGSASANDGNTLAMFFITGTPKLVDDGVAPVLVSTVPADGATGVSATGKVVLTFDERVKVAEGAKATLGSQELVPAVSGKTVTFEYKGLEYATPYTFTLPANTIGDLTDNKIAESISLSFTTMERPAVQKGMFDEVVGNVRELMAAIQKAENRTDKNVRFRIFVKNGSYTIPLSATMKTVNGYEVPECITFINSGNISFIGESRDGVVITNGIDKSETFAGTYGTTSKYDGIGNSDVFQIKGSDYYFQDLTIESGMDDATGRDLAVQDKATRTIYKNTGLRGYQDTWTSNNDNGLYYFEGGYVRGRTDYMCGKGDAYFNGVELRQVAGGYAAVPSKPAKIGWVYKDCVINGEAATVNYATGETRTAAQANNNYTLGRPWGQGTPVAVFIDTKMNVVPSAIGWNEMSNGWPARFAEYNSMTSTGTQIDLSGRKKTFGEGHANNPVLTAEEAMQYSDMHAMYGEWDPTLLTEQAPAPKNVIVDATAMKLSWDNSDYAFCWAIVKNDQVIGFTNETFYTIDDSTATWAVRAANEMGGLGEATLATSGTTGIKTVEQKVVNNNIYNLQGIRMEKAQKGLYIINGKKVVK